MAPGSIRGRGRRGPWPRRRARLACLLASSVAAAAAVGATAVRGAGPLVTGVLDPSAFAGPDRDVAFQHVAAAGGRVARLVLAWDAVAPAGAQKPPGFDARDPADPRYRFDAFDAQVRSAVAAGLQPLVAILGAPAWAQGGAPKERPLDGSDRPDPAALADFATAAAQRYGGGFLDLPRVRYWQVWNEPNLSSFLVPQYGSDGTALSPSWYRSMVNAASDALHAVHPGNVVVAGGLAPYGPRSGGIVGVTPFAFMRGLLCMSGGERPRATCATSVRFDAWSVHPYTSGGPTHPAGEDDGSLGNLGRIDTLLRAAQRAGHVVSSARVRFWVTEFSWDTSPPDPKGVPTKLHARWVSEALYRMWTDGVGLVVWYLIRDEPFTPATPSQSGLYFLGPDGIASDRPKPALRAFRFPFVAFAKPGRRIAYWGRTPAGMPGSVVVEQATALGWRRVASALANRYGIFAGTVRSAARTGYLRARLADGSDVSVPFGLRVPPDRDVCPFGTC